MRYAAIAVGSIWALWVIYVCVMRHQDAAQIWHADAFKIMDCVVAIKDKV